jgi:hypothetical protein
VAGDGSGGHGSRSAAVPVRAGAGGHEPDDASALTGTDIAGSGGDD